AWAGPGAAVAALGPAAATGLGLRLRRLQAVQLAASVGLTAAAVAAIGALGFVGLVAPHIARRLLGHGAFPSMAGSGLVGGLLLLAADSLGRIAVAPLQLPAGLVLAALGAPFLLILLARRG
ncbi:iron chelate uptake ABC transporter family permease subunit, partial [Roseomonas sp. 18066]|uniref:iron chelate uptake ABC transporter family permease subunit n=1 Tax=Roseomonas sp. 18066 TaxID=2681412 RepID=UPI00135867ED